MVHGIRATLNVHPNWMLLQVENAFNIVSHKVIF
jgi:hypothetical protein